MSAPAITYRPSAEVMTRSPKGEIAVNAWRPKERKAAPANWRERVAPFLAHISYLWGEDADIFLTGLHMSNKSLASCLTLVGFMLPALMEWAAIGYRVY